MSPARTTLRSVATGPSVALVMLLALASVPGWAGRPGVLQLDASARGTRLAGDAAAVRLYREGLRSVVAYVDTRSDLFPVARADERRLTGRVEGEAVRDVWARFLDYVLALDSIGRYYAAWNQLDEPARTAALRITQATFLAQYRFALEILDRLDRAPSLEPLLDEPLPELGLPAGTYARIRSRFLNAGRASEFAALDLLALGRDARELQFRLDASDSAAPQLRAGLDEDRWRLWQLGQGRGEALTAKDAAAIVRRPGFAAWFPVQAGVAQSLVHRNLWRPPRTRISAAQLDALIPRLQPGDILLVRRHWQLSDIGLPGFWPHAALYIGTPEERRRLFADPGVQAWIRTQGPADGDFERFLVTRYPGAYRQSLRSNGGRPPRVLEASSAGVLFSSLEQLAADSLAVLRPRLPSTTTAGALVRAFGYVGRSYDFDFDFRTDAAITSTELVYKAYEPAPDVRGLRLSLREILGRPVMPANELARQFDAEFGSPDQQLDLVVFLDGGDPAGDAVERGVDEFRQSWRRPKWRFLAED